MKTALEENLKSIYKTLTNSKIESVEVSYIYQYIIRIIKIYKYICHFTK